MSIDAVIGWVHEDSVGLRLDLVPRLREGHNGRMVADVPGQRVVWIAPPYTVRPVPGQVIWGGDGSVEIVGEDGVVQRYLRHGYTRLEELP